MKGPQLVAIRKGIGKTQEQMADLLGVSLIGLKRFETEARPIPAYIDHSAKAIGLCHAQGSLQVLEYLFKNSLPKYPLDTILEALKQTRPGSEMDTSNTPPKTYAEAITALINSAKCNFCDLDNSQPDENDDKLIGLVATIYNVPIVEVITEAEKKALIEADGA